MPLVTQSSLHYILFYTAWTNVFFFTKQFSQTYILMLKQNRSIENVLYLYSSHADKDKVDSNYTTVAFPQYQSLTISVVTM